MSVLLVSDARQDAHIPPVARELARRGVDVYAFDPATFPLQTTISIERSSRGLRNVLSWENVSLDLRDVRSVWYRRPGAFQLPAGLRPQEADWLKLECKQFIDGLWATTNALWVSDPERLRTANLKLLQLSLACELGFKVPDYLVTNDPGKAGKFIAGHPEGVVAKALGYPVLDIPGLGVGSIYTHRITHEDLDYLRDVRHGPTFFQAYVRKRRDIRVTVIGNRIFATGIESGEIAAAAVDFRLLEPWDIPHVPLTLPEPLERACRELVRRLGLNFGAIDLLETPDGEYLFLEINPNGQWYWLEMMTGVPMASTMADLLEAGINGQPTIPVPAPHKPATIPVGEHVVSLSGPVQQRLAEADAEAIDLAGTRLWLEHKAETVLLHVGDTDLNDR